MLPSGRPWHRRCLPREPFTVAKERRMTRKKIGAAPPKQQRPRKPRKGRPAGKKSDGMPQGARLQRSGQDHRPAGLDYAPDSYRDCLQVPTDQIDKDASAMAEI